MAVAIVLGTINLRERILWMGRRVIESMQYCWKKSVYNWCVLCFYSQVSLSFPLGLFPKWVVRGVCVWAGMVGFGLWLGWCWGYHLSEESLEIHLFSIPVFYFCLFRHVERYDIMYTDALALSLSLGSLARSLIPLLLILSTTQVSIYLTYLSFLFVKHVPCPVKEKLDVLKVA